MIGTLASVALGGALGASLRYLFGIGVFRFLGPQTFPVAILSVNVLGSFLMGVFVVLAAQRGLNHLSPFVMTGLLGGFTTFSAFSLEAVTLYERGDIGLAVAYIAASVVLSVLGLMLGLFVARGLLS
jgi:CrcB protein